MSLDLSPEPAPSVATGEENRREVLPLPTAAAFPRQGARPPHQADDNTQIKTSVATISAATAVEERAVPSFTRFIQKESDLFPLLVNVRSVATLRVGTVPVGCVAYFLMKLTDGRSVVTTHVATARG